MSKAKETLSFSQLLCVQALRIAEKDRLFQDRAEVELATAEREGGQFVNPLSVLARRAELLLPRHTPLSKHGIDLFLFGVFLPVVGLCMLALQLAGYWITLILQVSTHVVNVAGYVCLLGLQLAFLLWACLFLLPPVVWRWLPLGRFLPFVSVGGIIGAVTKFVTHVIPASWLNRMRPATAAEQEDRRSTAGLLPDMLNELVMQQPRVLGTLVALASHTYWLILSGWLLLLLGGFMLGERYDFRWRSTLLLPETVHRLVEVAGRPLERMVEVPSEEDIRWLMQESSAQPSHEDQHAGAAEEPTQSIDTPLVAERRARWGWFIVAVQFAYGVLPRLLLWMLTLALVGRVIRKAYTPDLKDPYYRKVLAHVASGELTEEPSETAEPETEPETPAQAASAVASPAETATAAAEEKGEVAQVTPAESVAAPPPAAAPESPAQPRKSERQPAAAADQTVLVSFEAEPPEGDWQSLLQLPGKVAELGDAERSRDRDRMLDWVREHGQQVADFVLLAEMTNTPPNPLRLFLEEVDNQLPAAAERYLILTCGERYRTQCDGDPERIAQRVSNWRQVAAHGRIPPKHVIDDFDHEHITPASRKRLANRISGESASGPLSTAGKFPQAADKIRRAVRKLAEHPPEEDFQRINVELREEIDRLYQDERSAFWEYVETKTVDNETLQAAAQATEAALSQTGDYVREGVDDAASVMVKSWHGLADLLGQANPRWLAGGAVAGILAAGSLVPAVSLPVVTLPYLLPASGALGAGVSQWLRSRLGDWVGRSQPPKDPLAGAEETVLENFVCSHIVWALVLELQGNSEERIASVISDVLSVAEEEPLVNEERVDAALTRMQEELAQLEQRSAA